MLSVHGAACLADGRAATWGTWAVGLAAALTGALLVFGLMTPLAGTLAAVVSAVLLSWLPSPTPNALGAGVAAALPVVVAAAIALLGPGAISADAALFGRREITIPHLPSRHDGKD